ncbi:MAG TPA: lipocalin family protein [Vicinamibacteria bacterium]|nr:lipocalin family protein [Vicinamibacteria bacterium]
MRFSWVLVVVLASAPVIEADDAAVETVRAVDLERYSGKWYEIARLPNRFQRDCIGATAEYRQRPDGNIGVVNTCYREDGSKRSVQGKAQPVDGSSNAKLRVRFNGFWFKLLSWLIKPNYWVIDLADDYSYAVVGTPDRDYLWILSRERTMDPATYERIVERIAAQGFDVDRISRTSVPESTHGI